MKDKYPKQTLESTAIVSSHAPSSFSRHYTSLDLILHSFGQLLAQFHPNSSEQIPEPSKNVQSMDLSPKEQRLSARLMRVNHAGEVCAQGLYLGQAFFCKDTYLQTQLLAAASEEAAHLSWCQERLFALQSRPSYFSAFWYTASLALGMLVSTRSDAFSLGFLEETERQVMKHLEGHLEQLSPQDFKTKAILTTMYQEEAQHVAFAQANGSKPLPWPIPHCMAWTAKIMTSVAYYI